MYILIGEQQAEAVDADEQRARFAHMADVVRRSPGFVRGWWGWTTPTGRPPTC